MRHLLGFAVAIALLAVPGSAGAAGPVPGGRYVGHTHSRSGSPIEVVLNLADDGKEFADGSWSAAELDCGRAGRLETEIFLADLGPLSRSVQVAPAGTFQRRSDEGRVSGRFTDHGRLARGSVAFPRDRVDGSACPAVHARFRARLIGRPNAPRPGAPSRCDRVRVAYSDELDEDEAYAPFEQGVGCTAAREFARRWHATPTCRGPAAGPTCAVPDASCQAIRDGRFSYLASARCSPASGGIVELVHYQPCPPPSDNGSLYMYFWSINLDCGTATAFPLAELIGDDETDTGPCGQSIYILPGRLTCKPVGGFTCVVRPEAFGPNFGFHGRCVDDQDHFLALELDYDFG